MQLSPCSLLKQLDSVYEAFEKRYRKSRQLARLRTKELHTRDYYNHLRLQANQPRFMLLRPCPPAIETLGESIDRL